MLYDAINVESIQLGDTFLGKGNLTVPVLYDGTSLVFSLRNKYISVNGIGTSRDSNSIITIRSKEYADAVEQMCKALEAKSPVSADGSFHARLGHTTDIVGANEEELKNARFEACISLTFSCFFDTISGRELQVYVKDLVLIKFINEVLEFELNKLELAK